MDTRKYTKKHKHNDLTSKEIIYSSDNSQGEKSKIDQFAFQAFSNNSWSDETYVYVRLITKKAFIEFGNQIKEFKEWKITSDYWGGYTIMVPHQDAFNYVFLLIHTFDPIDDFTKMELSLLHHIKLIFLHEIKENLAIQLYYQLCGNPGLNPSAPIIDLTKSVADLLEDAKKSREAKKTGSEKKQKEGKALIQHSIFADIIQTTAAMNKNNMKEDINSLLIESSNVKHYK